MTEGVDYLPQMADAWSELGLVLRQAGRTGEARKAVQEALRLQEAKGNKVSAARTRQALAALEAS